MEPPLLELKASYGLVEPVAFELPPLSEQCTPQVYGTFDLTKGAKNDKVLKLILCCYSGLDFVAEHCVSLLLSLRFI